LHRVHAAETYPEISEYSVSTNLVFPNCPTAFSREFVPGQRYPAEPAQQEYLAPCYSF